MTHTATSTAPTRKRQFGSEKRTEPLPTIHTNPSDRKIALSRIAIVATILFWIAYVVSTVVRQFIDGGSDFRFTKIGRASCRERV